MNKIAPSPETTATSREAAAFIRLTLSFDEQDGALYREMGNLHGASGSRLRAERVIDLATKGMIAENAYLGKARPPTAADLQRLPGGQPRPIRKRKSTSKRTATDKDGAIRIRISIYDSDGPIFGLLSALPAAIGTKHRANRLTNLAVAGLFSEYYATQTKTIIIQAPPSRPAQPVAAGKQESPNPGEHNGAVATAAADEDFELSGFDFSQL
jgi:hypothetical protein